MASAIAQNFLPGCLGTVGNPACTVLVAVVLAGELTESRLVLRVRLGLDRTLDQDLNLNIDLFLTFYSNHKIVVTLPMRGVICCQDIGVQTTTLAHGHA